VCPQKEEPNQSHITIGGNPIRYPGGTGNKTGSLELVKLMLNDVLSAPQALLTCFDISKFYLGTPLDRPEYVRIKLADIPQEFVEEYNLTVYAGDGRVYFKIIKGVTVLNRPESLPTTCSPNALQSMDTINASSRRDYGATNGDPSPLSSSWMTSASNT